MNLTLTTKMSKILKPTIIVLMLCSVFSCSKRPTFEEIENFYNGKEHVFEELAQYSCELGQSGHLTLYRYAKYYNKTDQQTIKKLDALLDAVNGKSIGYKRNSDNTCNLAVEIYRFQVPTSGVYYAYSYNKETPWAYDENLHTTKKVRNDKRRTNFDKPLFEADVGSGWYLTYADW